MTVLHLYKTQYIHTTVLAHCHKHMTSRVSQCIIKTIHSAINGVP